jgi:hypothetical protein
MKLRYAFVLLCTGIAGAALATVPASGPGSAVATSGAPRTGMLEFYSSPTGTAETYLRALNSGNKSVALNAMAVPAGHEAEVDAFVSLTIAQHWLQDAAVTRFKNDGDKVFLGDPKSRVTLTAQLKALSEQKPDVSGGTATLLLPPAESGKEPQKVLLKKVGEDWKLDAMSLYSLDSEKTPIRAALARKLASITEMAAKDVTAGKFSSATEAYQEYWTRMKEASQGSAATSRAATASAPAATTDATRK